MGSSRLIACSALLVAATGCASQSRSARLTPDNGPVVRVHATYSGGLTDRVLRASFSVDRPSYVLVGHLGGDGRISILYPENARVSNFVDGKVSYSVGPVYASYDGVPQLFSFANRAWRSAGARTDSYDGRGNGYIFVIASRYPMILYELHNYGQWNNDYEVDDYGWTSDPRVGVKYFAESVAGGAPFTLKYANSFGTNALTSYASMQNDCMILSTLGFGTLFFEPSFGWWGGGYSAFGWYFHDSPAYRSRDRWFNGFGAFGGACNRGIYALGSLGYNRYYWAYPGDYRPLTPAPSPAPTPTATPAPTARGTERSPGLRAGNASAASLALTRMREERSRQQALASVRRSERPTERREPERFSRPASASYGERGHAAPRATVSNSQPRATTRVETRASTPAAAAPAPSPKVQAASAGKPRDP